MEESVLHTASFPKVKKTQNQTHHMQLLISNTIKILLFVDWIEKAG